MSAPQDQPLPPHRIAVVGTSASGKSTLARQLSARTGFPHIELDALHWGANWTERPREELLRRLDEATASPAWIVDGNYGSIRDHLWPKLSMVVWLNYSRPVVYWRGLTRTLRRCVTGERLWHGNRETLRRTFFTKESMLWWILITYDLRRRQIAALRESSEYRDLVWVELRSPKEAEAWLERWPRPISASSRS